MPFGLISSVGMLVLQDFGKMDVLIFLSGVESITNLLLDVLFVLSEAACRCGRAQAWKLLYMFMKQGFAVIIAITACFIMFVELFRA